MSNERKATREVTSTTKQPRKRHAQGLYSLPLALQSAIRARLINHTLRNTKEWLAKQHRFTTSEESLSQFYRNVSAPLSLKAVRVPPAAMRSGFTLLVAALAGATVRVEFPALVDAGLDPSVKPRCTPPARCKRVPRARRA